jgi:hypothetical protein
MKAENTFESLKSPIIILKFHADQNGKLSASPLVLVWQMCYSEDVMD